VPGFQLHLLQLRLLCPLTWSQETPQLTSTEVSLVATVRNTPSSSQLAASPSPLAPGDRSTQDLLSVWDGEGVCLERFPCALATMVCRTSAHQGARPTLSMAQLHPLCVPHLRAWTCTTGAVVVRAGRCANHKPRWEESGLRCFCTWSFSFPQLISASAEIPPSRKASPLPAQQQLPSQQRRVVLMSILPRAQSGLSSTGGGSHTQSANLQKDPVEDSTHAKQHLPNPLTSLLKAAPWHLFFALLLVPSLQEAGQPGRGASPPLESLAPLTRRELPHRAVCQLGFAPTSSSWPTRDPALPPSVI